MSNQFLYKFSGSIPGWSYNTSRDTRSYVFPDNVTLLNQPRSICKPKQDETKSCGNNCVVDNDKNTTFLLVIICSSMQNFEAREAIRVTWGNVTNYEFLAKRIQNTTQFFQNVNVTDKTLNDFDEFTNFSHIDRRVRRDLSSDYGNGQYGDAETSDFDSLLQFDPLYNFSMSENNSDISDLGMESNDNFDRITNTKISSDRSVLLNDSHNRLDGIVNESLENNEMYESHNDLNLINKKRIKRKAYPKTTQKQNHESSDDARFDYGDNASEQPHVEESYVEDNKILGNFEEGDSSKSDNIDFYDYQTEVSNIMKIPPKGQKSPDDDENKLEDAKIDAKKTLELTISGDKLKLQSKSSKPLKIKKDILDQHVNFVENSSQATKLKNKAKSNELNSANTEETISPDIPHFDPPVRIKFLFLLGQSSNTNNTELQSKIDDESVLHGDIIQESFIDSYNNLTLKSIMLLKWVVSNCADNGKILKSFSTVFQTLYTINLVLLMNI